MDLASVRWIIVRDRPLHRRMGGVPSNVWGKIYSEVEIDDDLGFGLGLNLRVVALVPTAAQFASAVVAVVINDTGSGFIVGAT